MGVEGACAVPLRDHTIASSAPTSCYSSSSCSAADGVIRDKAAHFRARYPDRVPVICERADDCDLPSLDIATFLLPKSLTVGQMAYIVRKRLNLAPQRALYMFVGGRVPPCSMSLADLAAKYVDAEDGLVHVIYASEVTFG